MKTYLQNARETLRTKKPGIIIYEYLQSASEGQRKAVRGERT
jgi:hypothetical protein